MAAINFSGCYFSDRFDPDNFFDPEFDPRF